MIRTEFGCTVSRFAELVGVPRRSYHARLARHRAGDVAKGPWPAPQVDRIEPAVAKLAADWPAWGHRKIWAMGRYDGWDLASPSSVHRAMARRGLLKPVRYQAERRQLAAARREVFVDPPARTQPGVAGGLLGLRDHDRGHVAALRRRRLRRQGRPGVPRHGDPDRRRPHRRPRGRHRCCRGAARGPLIEDCVDEATGEIVPLAVVTDNGPAMKSTALARWFAARTHLTHVRTRHRSPWTNGVVERCFETLKYERLYREEIPSGIDLADRVADFIDEYNTIPPPRNAHLAAPPRHLPDRPNPQTETPKK